MMTNEMCVHIRKICKKIFTTYLQLTLSNMNEFDFIDFYFVIIFLKKHLELFSHIIIF